MKKIILIFPLIFFTISCTNTEASINKNLYNSLSVQENIVKTKIKDINSDILEKAINIIDRDVKNTNSIDKVTMYTFLKDVFEKELQERGNYTININQNNMEKFSGDTLNSNDLDIDTNPKKILIAYYSRSGNTETIAKYIEEITGGDTYEIELVEPYPEDYNEATALARKQIDEGFKPEIKAIDINLDEYDTIFLGSPLWRGTISTPVSSFLDLNNFSGKTIIPFITHGSSGISGSVDAIKKLAPNSNILGGKAFAGNGVSKAKNEVENWINDLDF